MRLRTKILLTVVLAVVVWMILGCCKGPEHFVPVPSATNGINTAYLERLYQTYNEGYFHNRLAKTPVINVDEHDPNYMATTICDEEKCKIQFNTVFITGARVAEFTMLHEMCHVKTWKQEVQEIGGKVVQIDHGKVWRSCMLTLDAEGAFREIIIDNYKEDM